MVIRARSILVLVLGTALQACADRFPGLARELRGAPRRLANTTTNTTTDKTTIVSSDIGGGSSSMSSGDDSLILILIIIVVVLALACSGAAFAFYVYRRRSKFDRHCEAIRQLEKQEDEYSAAVVQFTEKMEGQGGYGDRVKRKKSSSEPFSEDKHTKYLEEWNVFQTDHKQFIDLFTGALTMRRESTGQSQGGGARRTSVDRMQSNYKKELFPAFPATKLPEIQEQQKKLAALRTRMQGILQGFPDLNAELELTTPPVETIGSSSQSSRAFANDLPTLSGLSVEKDPALIEQVEMLKRLAHPLLVNAVVKPYGVLGAGEGQSDPKIGDPVEAVVIDPAGWPFIGQKNNPVGAGGAAASIYKWLAIMKPGGFPDSVHTAFKADWEGDAEMRAKYYAYKDGQHVIHVIGPKIRELLDGLSDLTRTYFSVLTEFCVALDPAKAPPKAPRVLRLLPISSGIFLMNKKLERYMAELTWSALSAAFTSLPPSSQDLLKTATFEVCIFLKKDLQSYESSLAEKKAIVSAGRPLLTSLPDGKCGPGGLPAKMGSFDWIRLKNGPADRLNRLQGFLLTEQAIWNRGFKLPDGKVVELADLNPLLQGTRVRRFQDDFKIRSLSGMTLDVRSAEAATVMEVAMRSQQQGKTTVAVSAASAYNPGGAALSGGRHALEETWCTMSTLLKSIMHAKQNNPVEMPSSPSSSWGSTGGRQLKPHIPVDGCIVSPGVEIFRDTSASGYSFQASTTKLLGVVSVAMFNMNPRMNDSPLDAPRDFIEYCTQVKQKFLAMTKAAAEMGAEVLVCPDIGCGVFENDPVIVGTMLGEALSELPGFFTEVWITGKTAFYEAARRAAKSERVTLERPMYYFTSGGPYECGGNKDIITNNSCSSMFVNVGGAGGTSASISKEHSGNIGAMRSGQGVNNRNSTQSAASTSSMLPVDAYNSMRTHVGGPTASQSISPAGNRGSLGSLVTQAPTEQYDTSTAAVRESVSSMQTNVGKPLDGRSRV